MPKSALTTITLPKMSVSAKTMSQDGISFRSRPHFQHPTVCLSGQVSAQSRRDLDSASPAPLESRKEGIALILAEDRGMDLGDECCMPSGLLESEPRAQEAKVIPLPGPFSLTWSPPAPQPPGRRVTHNTLVTAGLGVFPLGRKKKQYLHSAPWPHVFHASILICIHNSLSFLNCKHPKLPNSPGFSLLVK